MRRYNLEKLRHDWHAALNVTLLAVTQAIAFAAIAGLPVVYGVLCTGVAALVAPLFAASRHTIMGPTNATAFMLFSFFSVNPALAGRSGELIPLLVLMVGIFATLGALLRVADLMQFVSRSVLVGYISGAAVLILANQMTHLLGVGAWIDEASSASFASLVMGLIGALAAHRLGLAGDRVRDAGHLLRTGQMEAALAGVRHRPGRWPRPCFGSLIRFHVPPFEGAATFVTFGMDELMPRWPRPDARGGFQ